MKYKDVEKIVNEIMPMECGVVSVVPEGLITAIYIKDIKAFYNNDQLINQLASALKKKVVVRVDSSAISTPESAERKIKELVPKEANITNILFNTPFSEVHIEALKPGLVIGKYGSLLKEIVLSTGWSPKVLRTPTIPSATLNGIRKSIIKGADERKKFLVSLGKKVFQEPVKTEWVRAMALGGFKEVGRSCLLVQTPNSKVLIDCGVNPVSDDPKKAYPMLNMLGFPLSSLDAVIITHPHIDHMGFLPYLFAYGYEGPVYCTPPTRDLMILLQQDYLNLAKRSLTIDAPYSKKDIQKELKYVITVGYEDVVDITPEIKMTLYNAGHILGSSIVHLHIGEGTHNLVFTGDMKFGFTKLFDPAHTNFRRAESLFIESTYGGKDDVIKNRKEMELKLISTIKETIARGGHVLIPVFAVGRSQEILLVLEQYLAADPEFKSPVYIDGMVLEASAIHTAYPEYLRESLQRRILSNNSPFEWDKIKVAKGENKKEIIEGEPGVLLAPSGMLSGGPSYDYFKLLAGDSKHTILFVGYQSPLSLGSKVQKGMSEVPIMDEDGRIKSVEIKMHVETVEGFSVPYDTDVMIKRNGLFDLVPIGKIADEFIPKEKEGIVEVKGIEVPSFDNNGKINWKPVKQIIKHKRKKPHIKLKTKSGREVQISKGHSLFTLKNGEMKVIKGRDLNVGDHLVIPNQLPESHTLHNIEFASYIDTKGYTLNKRFGRFEPLKGGNNRSFIANQCNDTESLAKFLGYFAAEGHLDEGHKHSRATISFGNHEKELISDLFECSKKAFGLVPTSHQPHETEVQLSLHNKLLVSFLRTIGVGEGAHNKRVPSIVFNFNKRAQKQFLEAYFKGDGYFYKTGGKGYLAAKSVSRKLLSDISYLLLQHGIIARIKGPYKEKERMIKPGILLKESIVYKLYISEKDFEKIERKIGYLPFALPIKDLELKKIYKLIKDKKLRKLALDYVYNLKKNRNYIGIYTIKKFIQNINLKDADTEQKKILQTLNKFINADLALDIITEISEGETGEFEFDFSVPGTENFVGGIGGLMLHNSGHSDRSQLMAFMKNIRPTPNRIITMHGDNAKADDLARSASLMLRKQGQAMQNLEAIRLR